MNKNSVSDHALLDAIKIVSSNCETGRLEIIAEATRGAFFFKEGKLVHAYVGALNGFQAVNAALSMRGAQFNFDPLIPPPTLSSITVNERVVLKRFFGIETVTAEEPDHSAPTNEVDWDLTPAQVVPLTEAAQLTSSHSDLDEIAPIETQAVSEYINEDGPTSDENNNRSTAPSEQVADASNFSLAQESQTFGAPYPSSFWSRHRVGLYVVVFLLVTAAATFALVRKMNQLRRVTLMAQSSDSAPMTAPQQVNNQAPVDTPAVVVPAQQSNHSPSAVNSEPLNKQVATDSRSLPVTEQQSVQLEPESSSAHDLTGEWKVINTVEKTRYRSFENLEIGFRLVINQTGRDFTAKGEKISENGRILPPGDRTPIHMTGVIEGDKVLATFIEDGTVRRTNGRFVWRIQNSGAGLMGTFASTAARSQGTSAATKEL